MVFFIVSILDKTTKIKILFCIAAIIIYLQKKIFVEVLFIFLFITFFVLRIVYLPIITNSKGGFNTVEVVVTPIPKNFKAAVIVLCAAMMKKESKSKKDELIYFKRYYENQFKEQFSAEIAASLRNFSLSRIHISRICYQLSYTISYEERIHLLHFLYGFAFSDQYISDAELRITRLMGRFLGISQSDLDSIYAFYFIKKEKEGGVTLSVEKYFSILGVAHDATHDEIRKAYRLLAVKHHPDKVAHLGEEIQNTAKEKFQVIVDAYKKIKKARGF